MMLFSMSLNAIINSTMELYISSKLLKENIKENLKLFLIADLFLALYLLVSFNITQTFVRTVILFIIIVICNLLIYNKRKKSISKIIIVSFIVWLSVLIAEALLAILLVGILKIDLVSIQENAIGYLITNCLIMALFYLITTNGKVMKFCVGISNKFELFKGKYLITIALLSTIAFSIIFYLSYFKFDATFTFVMALIVVVIYTFVIYKLFEEKEKSIQMRIEYKALEKNLNEYEEMYKAQRMANHEHKNELSIIRGLTKKTNKKLLDYIDKLIDIQTNGNDKWMNKLKEIPEGGLRGILYYKMSLMDKNKINIDFEISKNVKSEMIRSINEDVMFDLCKLLGIYLDNAIQAVLELKEKNIKVSIYCEESNASNLVISIMNNYQGDIELCKISEPGYSTKGKEHGFGLSIAQLILDADANIINNHKIIRNNFMQELKVKL